MCLNIPAYESIAKCLFTLDVVLSGAFMGPLILISQCDSVIVAKMDGVWASGRGGS